MQNLKLKEVINIKDTKYNKKTLSDLNIQKINDLKKDKSFLINVSSTHTQIYIYKKNIIYNK